jgi:hypothetical protein
MLFLFQLYVGLLTLIAALFSLLASVWRKQSSAQQECIEEDKLKVKNRNDVISSSEQGQALMSNDA